MGGVMFDLTPKSKRARNLGPKWNRQNRDDLNCEGVSAVDSGGTVEQPKTVVGGGSVSANAQKTETVGGQPKTVAENVVVANGADYRANAPYNSVDYAKEYLGGNGMSAEEMKVSPVVNHDNPIVKLVENPDVRTADMVDLVDKDASNVDWLKGNDLVDDMEGEYAQYMENAPEYVSEEEQKRRLRASMSSKAVADLGSIASAFANLYGTGQGAMNQQVAYAEAPDYQALVDKWQAQRNQYRTYAQKGRDYVYNRRRQEILDEYTREKNDIDLQYKQAQIELSKARESAVQQQNAIKLQEIERKAREAEEKHNLELLKLNETKRKNDATIALGYARLAEDRRNHNLVNSRVTSNGGGRSSGNWHIANASGMSVDVPKANINDHNRSELLKLCGSDGYKTTQTKELDLERSTKNKPVYKTKREKMTKDEMWNYIVNNMNPKAERYIVEQLGGQVYGGPSEEAKVNEPKASPAPIYKTKDGKTFTDGNEYQKHLKELEEQEKKAKANGGVSANAQNTGAESGGAPKADAQKGNAPKASAPKTDAKASGSGASEQKGKTASGSGKKASNKVEVAKTVDGKNYDKDGKEIIEW